MEDLPLDRTATLVPAFAVKDLPLGTTHDDDTVEPRYSELIGGVVCSDLEMFGLSKKKKQMCTDANTALGLPATWQRDVRKWQHSDVRK